MKITARVKLASAVALISVILAILVVALYLRNKAANEEEEKIKFVSEHTAREQQRLGIDCGQLKLKIAAFLREKIDPIIETRRQGETWSGLVSQDLRNELGHYEEFLFTCARLYMVGESGRLNALQGLTFVDKATNEFSTIATLLKYAETSQEFCDKQCLDAKFRLLQDSYSRLKDLLDGRGSTTTK